MEIIIDSLLLYTFTQLDLEIIYSIFYLLNSSICPHELIF